VTSLRLKFGRNPYTSELACAHCRRRFAGSGLYARLEHANKIVDVPVCPVCVRRFGLFEGEIDLGRDSASRPIGLA
jgi:hypothetical protein